MATYAVTVVPTTNRLSIATSSSKKFWLWSGEYLLLWQRETDEVLIGPDTRGEPILWLRKRLAQRLGISYSEDPTWDEELRKNVQRAQTAMGTQPDGIAGPRTLMGLSSQPGPVLTPRGQSTP